MQTKSSLLIPAGLISVGAAPFLSPRHANVLVSPTIVVGTSDCSRSKTRSGPNFLDVVAERDVKHSRDADIRLLTFPASH
jgi:hypothetical protein